MYIYDMEIKTEDISATGIKTVKRIRLAQFCPANTDVSMWLKRIVQLLFESTGNTLALPGTNEVIDIENPQEIRLAPST